MKGCLEKPLPNHCHVQCIFFMNHMGVSKNRVTPKSSILIGLSIINHPFWGTPIFGKTHIPYMSMLHDTGVMDDPSKFHHCFLNVDG